MCELTIRWKGRSDYKEPIKRKRYDLIPVPANITFVWNVKGLFKKADDFRVNAVYYSCEQVRYRRRGHTRELRPDALLCCRPGLLLPLLCVCHP